MNPYLTASEIMERLENRFGLTDAPVFEGDADAASDELDAMRPFIGYRYVRSQWRAFPRSVEPDGTDGDGTIPDAVLDVVSLIAYSYATDEEPPITQELVSNRTSVSYATPKVGVLRRRIQSLMKPYMRRRGQTSTPRPLLGADPLNQR